MAFPKKYLNDGEEIILDLRPHWFFLVGAGAALIGALALAIWAGVAGVTQLLLFPALALALVALLFFLKRYSEWITTDFVLTTDRLIFRKGVLSRQGKEIPLERLNDVSYHQSLFQRLLGAGDLLVESGGERPFFLADLAPTTSHVPLPWIMGYDVEPLVTLETKRRIFAQAEKENWCLIYEHDAKTPWSRIRHDGKSYVAAGW